MKRWITAATSAALLLTGAVHADGQHKHHFAKDVEAFHRVLSPLWHAPASPERSANTCKAAPELIKLAGAIRSADASALKAKAELLQKQCANAPTNIETEFSALHDAFHALIGE
ncbi:MAG: hypothetical protein ACOY3E_13435 [Pseudomonadota bacterium]